MKFHAQTFAKCKTFNNLNRARMSTLLAHSCPLVSIWFGCLKELRSAWGEVLGRKSTKKDLAVPSMIMYFHINLQKVCESADWHKGCDTFKFHTSYLGLALWQANTWGPLEIVQKNDIHTRTYYIKPFQLLSCSWIRYLKRTNKSIPRSSLWMLMICKHKYCFCRKWV